MSGLVSLTAAVVLACGSPAPAGDPTPGNPKQVPVPVVSAPATAPHATPPVNALLSSPARSAPEQSIEVEPMPTEPERRPEPAVGRPPAESPASAERTWRDVVDRDIDVNLVFVNLPPDYGVVAPINPDYRPSGDAECIRNALPAWPPARADDPVQRARNALLVAATADLLQLPVERDVPLVVFEYLRGSVPADDLVKVLYWVATHPADGSLAALDELPGACLDVYPPDDIPELRNRVGLYATKFVGKVTGRLP